MTCSGLTPINFAKASQQLSASAIPCSPVAALALPELIKKNRLPARSRCLRLTNIGAAAKADLVKIPAELLPSANSSNTRSNSPLLLIPQAIVASRTPRIILYSVEYGPTAIKTTYRDRPYISYRSHMDRVHSYPLFDHA